MKSTGLKTVITVHNKHLKKLDMDKDDVQAVRVLDRIAYLGKGFVTRIQVNGTELWFPGKDPNEHNVLFPIEVMQRLLDLKYITSEGQPNTKTPFRLTQSARNLLSEFTK
jgi:hypothetical protein